MNESYSYTRCRFGVAQRDVTPPVGIYARSWGAATHDVAEGVHRPLTATAAVFAPLAGDGPTLALVALDIGWFQYAPDERAFRASVLERTGLGEAELLIQMSHTHAGANTNSRLEGKPGAELIAPYLEHLAAQVGDAVVEARSTATEAFVTYGYGRCGLAANRDFWDAEAERFACGYNPDGDRGRHAARGARDRRRRPDARDAVQLRLSPDDPRVGEPASLARLHRRRARGAGGGVRGARALPAGRLGRARATRRLRRRPGGRRPERPPARPRRGGGDRGAAPAGHPLRLHGDRRLGREPRHVGVPALRARAARRRRPPRGRADRRRARAEG